MSIKIMTLIKSLRKSDLLKLSGPTKAIFLNLADHATHEGNKIYPSHQTIADETGYSVRTVQVHLKLLKELGLITIRHHFINGYQTSNKYTINLDNLNAFLDMQKRTLRKKELDKTVDKIVNNAETRMVVGGAAAKDKSSDHDLYIKEETITCGQRRMLWSELLAKGVYEKEIVTLSKRYGLSKIFYVKKKIEDLIRKGKIIVKNFGAYLRKTLMNEFNDVLKPLIKASMEHFKIIPKENYCEKRESPKEFKELSSMLKKIVPNN
jgi:DNA-binding transcriptional ArsR family regulator